MSCKCDLRNIETNMSLLPKQIAGIICLHTQPTVNGRSSLLATFHTYLLIESIYSQLKHSQESCFLPLKEPKEPTQISQRNTTSTRVIRHCIIWCIRLPQPAFIIKFHDNQDPIIQHKLICNYSQDLITKHKLIKHSRYGYERNIMPS